MDGLPKPSDMKRKQGTKNWRKKQAVITAAPVQTDSAPGVQSPWFERYRKPGWFALSGLIFLFYFWTATSSNRPFHPRDTSHDLYNQLTESLVHGHLALPIPPSPQLLALKNPYDPAANEKFRLHDASLYRGRYYLYHGIAPVVTLYLPWRLLTGTSLSDDVAVIVFAMGGYVFSCLLLFLLMKASGMRVPWILQTAAAVALGLGQVSPIVLRRPRMYEVAVSAGFCFLLAALYFLARSVVRPNSSRLFPVLAALFFGLATGGRPQYAIVVIFVAIGYGLYLLRVRGFHGPRWLKEFAFLLVPLAVAAVLLGWYNYARFDNPFEFGVTYQTGVQDFSPGHKQLDLRWRYAVASLYYLLICPANFLPRFPFLELSGTAMPFGNPDLLPADYFYEPTVGILVIAPLCILAFAAPVMLCLRTRLELWLRTRLDPGVRAVLLALAGCGLILIAVLCGVQAKSARYQLDFVPELSIVAIFLWICLSLHLRARWMRVSAAVITVAGCCWASAANVALSINSYGYQLEQPYSPLFRSIAGFFGAGPDAFLQDVNSLSLDATVTFPHAEPGTRETLLASGMYERWDLVFVQYEPGGKAIFAFVHCGVSDTQTSPIPISPGTPHHLSIRWTAESKKLAVTLDDRLVLDYPTGYYPTSRDRITIGRIKVGRFGQREFSGSLDVAPRGLVFVPRSQAAPRAN